MTRYLPSWRSLVAPGAFVVVGWLLGASTRPNAPTPATDAQDGNGAGRYQLQVSATYAGANVFLLDSSTGQVWLLNREALAWRALPAIERNE